ncbi:MAG: Ig-like domain-containing protein, partial [Candidatus Hydrogenedentota bacterium]
MNYSQKYADAVFNEGMDVDELRYIYFPTDKFDISVGSVTFWVIPEQAGSMFRMGSGKTNDYPKIWQDIYYGPDASFSKMQLYFLMQEFFIPGRPTIAFNNDSKFFNTNGIPIMITFTWGPDGMKIYENTTFIASYNYSGELYVNYYPRLSCWNPKINLYGIYDDFGVYNRQLSQDEINALYNADNLMPDDLDVYEGDVSINYYLTDRENENLSISIEYSLDGVNYKSLTEKTGTGSEGKTNLSSDNYGVPHLFVWDSVADSIALTEPEDVYIRVKPFDSIQEGVNSIRKYKVDNNPAPEPPQNLRINGLTFPQTFDTNTLKTVSWEFIDKYNGTQNGFELQLSNDTNFTNIFYTSGVVNSSDTWFDIPFYLAEGKYYVRIRTRDNGNKWSGWSSGTEYFIIAIPGKDAVPDPIYINGQLPPQTLSNYNITISWDFDQPQKFGQKGYRIIIGTDDLFNNIVYSTDTKITSDQSYFFNAEGILNPMVNYYVDVIVIDNAGNIFFSIKENRFIITDTSKIPPTVRIDEPVNEEIITDSKTVTGEVRDSDLMCFELFIKGETGDTYLISIGSNNVLSGGVIGIINANVIPLRKGDLILRVYDFAGNISMDSKSIYFNRTPVANAGSDVTLNNPQNVKVILDGSASFDPDQLLGDTRPLNYKWYMDNGDGIFSELNDVLIKEAITTDTIINGGPAGTSQFRYWLKVEDGDGNSSIDDKVITIKVYPDLRVVWVIPRRVYYRPGVQWVEVKAMVDNIGGALAENVLLRLRATWWGAGLPWLPPPGRPDHIINIGNLGPGDTYIHTFIVPNWDANYDVEVNPAISPRKIIETNYSNNAVHNCVRYIRVWGGKRYRTYIPIRTYREERTLIEARLGGLIPDGWQITMTETQFLLAENEEDSVEIIIIAPLKENENILVRIDFYGVNIDTTPFDVYLHLSTEIADLEARGMSIHTTTEAETRELEFQMANDGSLPAENFTVEFRRTEFGFFQEEEMIGIKTIPVFNPGDTLNIFMDIPWSSSMNKTFFKALIDPQNTVKESDEDNNYSLASETVVYYSPIGGITNVSIPVKNPLDGVSSVSFLLDTFFSIIPEGIHTVLKERNICLQRGEERAINLEISSAEGTLDTGLLYIFASAGMNYSSMIEVSLAPADIQPARTSLIIGSPQATGGVDGQSPGDTFVTTMTRFTFNTIDDLYTIGDNAGYGVKSICYLVDTMFEYEYKETFTLQGLSDGKHIIQYWSMDKFGNVEPRQSVNLWVDNTAPGLVVSIGEPRYKKASMTYITSLTPVTASASDAGVGMLKFSSPDVPVTEGLHTLVFSARDLLGNQADSTVVVTIDNKAPEIVIESPGAKSYVALQDSIVIDFSVIDNFDNNPTVISYLIDLEESTVINVTNGEIIEPLTLDDGFWRLVVSAKDFLGHITELHSARFEVIHDIQAPRTTVSFSAPYFESQTAVYITSATSITLSAIDDLINYGDGIGLGVSSIEYSINSSEYITYTTPINITSEGIYYFQYLAIDVIGNVETTKILSLIVDNSPPVLSIEPVTTPTNQSVTLNITVSDNYTPVENIVITGDNSPYTSEGIYTETITATDLVGNQTSVSVSFIIDLTPPVISIDIGDPKYSSNPTFVTSQTPFTINATDNLTGVVETAYKIDDGEYIIIQGLGVGGLGLVEGEHTITVRCKDGAGNIGSASID